MMSDIENIVVDEQKVIRIIKRVYVIERDNTKTAKYSDKDMKKLIEKIIEEEVKKCY